MLSRNEDFPNNFLGIFIIRIASTKLTKEYKNGRKSNTKYRWINKTSHLLSTKQSLSIDNELKRNSPEICGNERTVSSLRGYS